MYYTTTPLLERLPITDYTKVWIQLEAHGESCNEIPFLFSLHSHTSEKAEAPMCYAMHLLTAPLLHSEALQICKLYHKSSANIIAF